jgi:hypothetical protein
MHGEEQDSYVYGPFEDDGDAAAYLEQFSNTGGYSVDPSGEQPVPKRSPNGRPVQKPRRRELVT